MDHPELMKRRFLKSEWNEKQYAFVFYLSGVLLWLGWICLTIVSGRFVYATNVKALPVIEVVLALIVMSGIALVGLAAGLRGKEHSRVWPIILGLALGMRGVALFSNPIFEIDYYRYLWDGQTLLQGVSPYAYAPDQILSAIDRDDKMRSPLQRLARRCEEDATWRTILHRIHFSNLPTIYPPVSQLIFAWSVWTIPENSSVETSIIILKFWLVCFDVGVIFMLGGILRMLKMPIAWTVAYAWNPLVIKEFSNSGHLDSIAVFLTMVAIYALIRGMIGHADPDQRRLRWTMLPERLWITVSAMTLGLAIGAKLFPLVLVPVMTSIVMRRRVVDGFLFVSVAGVFSWLTCFPMWSMPMVNASSVSVVKSPVDEPPGMESLETEKPKLQSLQTFLTKWKMNDVIFRFVSDTLDPEADKTRFGWHIWTPRSWREQFVAGVQSVSGLSRHQIPFLAARGLLAGLLLILIIRWCVLAQAASSLAESLEYAFLSLAWFWALSPTLNPWYWTWALPLVPFARSRAWLLVSSFVFLYYTRFWFHYVWGDAFVFGTIYRGERFFHDVVVWVEHLPWMLLLLWDAVGSWSSNRSRLITVNSRDEVFVVNSDS